MKKFLKYLLILLLILIARAIGSYYYVEQSSEWLIHHDIKTVGTGQTVLLLGTAPTLRDGRPNLFYTYRIQAVVNLRKAGVVKHILISGDNRHQNYNEPKKMKQSLTKAGIPENIIELDYAGFRTLDSIVRARDVFHHNGFLVVSQPFHIKRAITIARHHNIKALGFPAQNVSTAIAPRVYLREILARMRMTLDLFILHTKPHFPK